MSYQLRTPWLGIFPLILAALFCAGATDVDEEDPPAAALTSLDEAAPEPLNEKQGLTKPLSISLTVSGGVSLGAYQAGYLFYLTEVAKLNKDLINPRLVTGASAGMINSLLTVMAMGDDAEEEPAKSLFYRIWNDLHYRDLFDVDQAPPLALSSRKVLEDLAAKVEKRWIQGLDENLDMVIGATATRLKSHSVNISAGFTVPRQEEKFIFRIQGRGPGRRPRVTNYVDRVYGSEQPLLPFVDVEHPVKKGEHTNFSVIKQILFASSAIPIVFLPQQIDFCMTSPNDADKEHTYALRACPKPKFHEDFVDGSIADRRPLRLAHRIAVSGLVREDNALVWRNRPDLEHGTLPDSVYFLYIDPTRHTYPETTRAEENKRNVDQATRFFPTLGVFMRSLLSSAQAKEVSTLIEEHPDVRERMQLVTHDYPKVSGLMAKFFGFFDREFRKFDFYLGMRDAHRYVEENVTPRLRHMFDDDSIQFVFPEPAKEAAESILDVGSWRPYFCLRSVIDGEKEYGEACDSDELRDFRILLQIAFDRLYDQCRRLPMDETLDHLHCKKAMAGESPPWILKSENTGDSWKRRDADEEGELQHAMRLFESYEFHFRDLELDRDDASLAMSRIRMEMLVLLDEFAKKLPRGERLAVRLLGKPAVNFFNYAPPDTILYFVAGTAAEFALSANMGHSTWLRYNFALQTQGFYYLLTEQPNVLTLTPLIGLEAELRPASGPLLQTRFGLRIGYQFSTGDKFLGGACDTDIFANDSLRCSAPVAQAFLALSFYERIRLQGGVEWFPRWLSPMDAFKDDVWNGFLEVGWQWISPF
ncbi:MAG: patatin-like phospholipase family protein [Deltaproteobacteria bacterium]|nr:patatin-like phospholipase family protein [Deltaproteobacteria bacterium]